MKSDKNYFHPESINSYYHGCRCQTCKEVLSLSTLRSSRYKECLLIALAAAVCCIPQIILTYAARDRFWYEELAESIRNPFWLANQTIFDGVSGNIGWYGLLVVVYKIFGFSLVSAKVFRVGLHFAALVCLITVLKRFLSWRLLLVPLATIALSPSMLYLTTFQASFGIDLQWCLVSLAIFFCIDFNRPKTAILLHAFLGAVVMLASLCYGAFLFYLPVIALSLLSLHWRAMMSDGLRSMKVQILSLSAALIAFAGLLTGFALCLKKPSLLFFDPNTGSGLFRGGGGELKRDFSTVLIGIRRTLEDLFERGDSYYFYLGHGEFSNKAGYCAFALCLMTAFWAAWKTPRFRLVAILAVVLLTTGIVVPNFASGPPGLRRCTAILAAFYGLFVVGWIGLNTGSTGRLRNWGIIVSCLLVGHHIFLFPRAYEQLSNEGRNGREPWLSISATPEESLAIWRKLVSDGKPIDCRGTHAEVIPNCRLSEIYSVVAADQLWNAKQLPNVRAIDPKSGEEITLSTELWENYYFSH